MTFFGISADAIAHDDHQVTAIVTVANSRLHGAGRCTADHHHCPRAAIVENRFELVADKHRRSSLINDNVVLTRFKWFHELPAEAAVEPARFQLAWIIDLLIFHASADPRRRLVLPQKRRLSRVDGFDPPVSGCGNNRRAVAY